MEQDYIKLIFGLKLKQIRTDKNLSLFGLSKISGLSKSYLNEIEKGKKYPKTDKIIILSEKLDMPYDQMVSLKLVIQRCHKRNILAIGGMAAQIPIKNNEKANAAALEKVRVDKEREVKNGHDGTWVAHPALVEVAKKDQNSIH